MKRIFFLYLFLFSFCSAEKIETTEGIDRPWVVSGQKLINIIEASEADGAFLKVPDGVEIMQLYIDFASDLKPLNDYEEPWYISDPIFADLALAIIKKYKKELNWEKERDENDQMFMQEYINEAERKKEEKKSNYRWFLLIIERVSILLTTPEDRSDVLYGYGYFLKLKHILPYVQSLNEPIPQHRPLCLDDEEYARRQELLKHNPFTTILSTTAQAKFFPNIVFLPCCFEMSKKDILLSMYDGEVNIWLCGLPIKKTEADNVDLGPFSFYAHDLFHFFYFIQGFLYVSIKPIAILDDDFLESFYDKQKRINNDFLLFFRFYKKLLRESDLSNLSIVHLFDYFHETLYHNLMRISHIAARGFLYSYFSDLPFNKSYSALFKFYYGGYSFSMPKNFEIYLKYFKIITKKETLLDSDFENLEYIPYKLCLADIHLCSHNCPYFDKGCEPSSYKNVCLTQLSSGTGKYLYYIFYPQLLWGGSKDYGKMPDQIVETFEENML